MQRKSPEQHKRRCVELTVAMVAITIIAIGAPYFTNHVTVAGLFVNLVWLWDA